MEEKKYSKDVIDFTERLLTFLKEADELKLISNIWYKRIYGQVEISESVFRTPLTLESYVSETKAEVFIKILKTLYGLKIKDDTELDGLWVRTLNITSEFSYKINMFKLEAFQEWSWLLKQPRYKRMPKCNYRSVNGNYK